MVRLNVSEAEEVANDHQQDFRRKNLINIADTFIRKLKKEDPTSFFSPPCETVREVDTQCRRRAERNSSIGSLNQAPITDDA